MQNGAEFCEHMWILDVHRAWYAKALELDKRRTSKQTLLTSAA
jgi:hypothetical protein